jgi:hypothetical protein
MIERIFAPRISEPYFIPLRFISHLWGQFMVHAFLYADFRQNFAQASAQDSLYFF